jgi:hypothetical protein
MYGDAKAQYTAFRADLNEEDPIPKKKRCSMKRVRMAGFVVLAFLFCSIPGHAQDIYVTLHSVLTPGGTANAVPKFITATHIGNSAISETGGNVTITGGMAAGGAVSGTTGTFSGNITANGTIFGITALGSNGPVSGGNSGFGGNALNGLNNSNNATLSLTNRATPANTNFTEAQFNATKATFFTDTKGDSTAIGTKSAAVPLLDGSMAKVFSVESPEVWFEDYGADKLSGGMVTVSLEEKFTQTVNLSKGYHVFLTPKGDCKGLYVTNETETGFEVREMGGGGSNVEFDYRIVAHRKGYEDLRLPAAVMPKLPTE